MQTFSSGHGDQNAFLTSSCPNRVMGEWGDREITDRTIWGVKGSCSPDHPISRSPDCYVLQVLTFSHPPDLAERSTASSTA
jgi:hypothetical protein